MGTKRYLLDFFEEEQQDDICMHAAVLKDCSETCKQYNPILGERPPPGRPVSALYVPGPDKIVITSRKNTRP